MKLPKILDLRSINKKWSWKYYLLAFMLPFVAMLVALLVKDCVPFGEKYMILYCDEYHQYYPFFLSFRNALRNGDSLMYCWDMGMGVDFLGLIAYYLASPLNLFSILIPDSMAMEYFALLTPLKLGFAGLFFAIFLRNTFGKNDLSIVLFGGFYALCAWAMGYLWNVMWLDTFALLPLVVLGTIRLLKEKKFVLYTLALAFAVGINYYIGFFICIFVLLIFICYQICRCKSFSRLCGDFGRIAVFTVLGLGMTLVMTLPALSALQDTYSTVNHFPENFELNIATQEACKDAETAWKTYKAMLEAKEGFFPILGGFFTAIWKSIPPILDGMRQSAGNMGGALTPSFKEGLPNLYCGVGTISMAFLFLTAKNVKVRDKICSVLLLIFFMVSFIIRQLDYIWHGFHFPNQIPYRFSFLFSFVMLYMAYRAWLLRNEFKLWQPIVAGVLSVGIILCAGDFSFTYLAFNLAFVALYIGMFIFMIVERKISAPAEALLDPFALEKVAHRRQQAITLIFSGIMLAELILSMVNWSYEFPRTNITGYPKGGEDLQSAINYMEYRERNSPFYRAEVTHTQSLNDGSLNGYHGITTFTSSANVRVTRFMHDMGYSANDGANSYVFEEGSPVSAMFLNLKYMIERDGDVEDNPYFDTIHNFGNVYLQENNKYLPLGFLAESTLADYEFLDDANFFTKQNDFFRAATGVDKDVWYVLKNSSLTTEYSEDIIVGTSTSSGLTSYSTKDRAGTARYTYTTEAPGFLCLQMRMTRQNSYKIYLNGQELYKESTSYEHVASVCRVFPGDEIELEITCKSNESGTLAIRAAVVMDKVLEEGYRKLAASTLQITDFSNSKVIGTINCDRDGLLYTSITDDGNWVVEVDGKPVDYKLVGDCMIGVELTKGAHEIRFIYRNKAFTTGLAISITCAAVFVGIIVVTHIIQNRKGKFVKPEEN